MIFTNTSKVSLSFKNPKVTKPDIFFFKFDKFMTLRLKIGKTDVNHTEPLIVMKVTNQENCTLTALCKSFFKVSKLAYAPPFSQTRWSFSHKYLFYKYKSCVAEFKTEVRNYLSSSFQRSEVKYVSNCKIFQKNIQKLWY